MNLNIMLVKIKFGRMLMYLITENRFQILEYNFFVYLNFGFFFLSLRA